MTRTGWIVLAVVAVVLVAVGIYFLTRTSSSAAASSSTTTTPGGTVGERITQVGGGLAGLVGSIADAFDGGSSEQAATEAATA